MWRIAPVLALLASAAFASGQDTTGWIGKRVITKYGTVLRVGAQVVDDEQRGTNLALSGREKRTFRIYRVEKVKGPWLWLADEKGGVQGWARVVDVILFDQAIDYFTNEIRANPGWSDTYNDRGLIWEKKGEHDIAIGDYDEAIRLDPQNEAAYTNRGIAWHSKNQFAKAIADHNQALRIDPKYVDAYCNRGNAWLDKKEFVKAIADYDQAIRLDPEEPVIFTDRGIAWRHRKEYARALADYNQAIRLAPKYASAFNSRAWLWATCPDERYRDGKRAVDSATRACELSQWKDANMLGTLAAAYAESGDFDKAVEYQEKAHNLYSDDDKTKWGKLLDLYKDKKPYRDEE